MNADPDYLRRMPKVELHCHLEGSVPALTALDLARRNGVKLRSNDPAELYRFADLEDFLVTYQAVSRSMVTAEDFAKVTYDCLAEAARDSNVRYREMSFNPTNHPDLSYPEMIAGITDGLRGAEADFGLQTRITVAINREQSPAVAADLLRTVAAHPSDYVVAVGLDHNELVGPPEAFAEAYAIAAGAGLHRTAHAGERGDSGEITRSIDALGIERVDHGYAAAGSPELITRSIDENIHYAACWQTQLFHVDDDVSRSRIPEMIAAGLSVSISSDDPPMLHTDMGTEYVNAGEHLGWSVEDAEQLVLRSVDATFLDESDKSVLRSRLANELAAFRESYSAVGVR